MLLSWTPPASPGAWHPPCSAPWSVWLPGSVPVCQLAWSWLWDRDCCPSPEQHPAAEQSCAVPQRHHCCQPQPLSPSGDPEPRAIMERAPKPKCFALIFLYNVPRSSSASPASCRHKEPWSIPGLCLGRAPEPSHVAQPHQRSHQAAGPAQGQTPPRVSVPAWI